MQMGETLQSLQRSQEKPAAAPPASGSPTFTTKSAPGCSQAMLERGGVARHERAKVTSDLVRVAQQGGAVDRRGRC
jgi:hypothetical protein